MKQEQQEKLGQDYADYLAERDKLAAEGRAIGTFISWQYENNLVKIKIANTWEEHKRLGIQYGD